MEMMMKYVFLQVVLLVLVQWSLTAENAVSITVSGTGDSQELLRVLAAAFEKQHPGKKVIVPDSIGSSGGVKATAKGLCDLGRVARPLKQRELKYKLNYLLFAYCPVVFVTNPAVVDSLTEKQIVSVYAGQIKNWQDLGGTTGPIFVANREAGDSCRSIIEKKLPGFKKITRYAGKTIYSTPENADIISKTKGIIGYVPLSIATHHQFHVLQLNGIAPTVDTVTNHKYPLVLSFGLVWKGTLKGLQKKFVDFIFSPAGSTIIQKNGCIAVHQKKESK